MSGYMDRIVDRELEGCLERSGVVVIEGPKSCGKTETARQATNSELLLDIDDNAEKARLAPSVVLQGATPRLLDEYQVAPSLWNRVRREVDDRSGRTPVLVPAGS